MKADSSCRFLKQADHCSVNRRKVASGWARAPGLCEAVGAAPGRGRPLLPFASTHPETPFLRGMFWKVWKLQSSSVNTVGVTFSHKRTGMLRQEHVCIVWSRVTQLLVSSQPMQQLPVDTRLPRGEAVPGALGFGPDSGQRAGRTVRCLHCRWNSRAGGRHS